MNIQFSKNPILKWIPTLLMLVAIFLFSARPSTDVQYSLLRHIMYKSGHVLGYAMLTLSFWRALDFKDKRIWLAWLMALLYALTDEYHQSFVPGRHPAMFDVLVFDNVGALISVWFATRFPKQKQPIPEGLVVEQEPITVHR